MATSAQALKTNDLATIKQTIEKKEIEVMSVTDGYVAQKNGNYIVVSGEAVQGEYNELILNINDETEIVDTRGNNLNKDKIKEGSVVEVVYEGRQQRI